MCSLLMVLPVRAGIEFIPAIAPRFEDDCALLDEKCYLEWFALAKFCLSVMVALAAHLEAWAAWELISCVASLSTLCLFSD